MSRLQLPGDDPLPGEEDKPKYVQIEELPAANSEDLVSTPSTSTGTTKKRKRKAPSRAKRTAKERKVINSTNVNGARWRGIIKDALLPKINQLVDTMPRESLYAVYKAPWNDMPIWRATQLLEQTGSATMEDLQQLVNQMLTPEGTQGGGVLPTDPNKAQSADSTLYHVQGPVPTAQNEVPYTQMTGSNMRAPVRGIMTLDQSGLHLHPGQPRDVVNEQLIRPYDQVSGARYGPYYIQNRGSRMPVKRAQDAVILLNHD